MTREIGPELVARLRHVADSLEAIAKRDADSPEPSAYAVYVNGEYDSSYGPDAIDEAMEIAADCNGDVVPLHRTPQTHTTQGEGSVQRECTRKVQAPAAWMAVAFDGSESSAVYAMREQAEAAAREWGWQIAPLYCRPQPTLTDEERQALEKAINVAQLAGHIDFPLVIRWLLERTE